MQKYEEKNKSKWKEFIEFNKPRLKKVVKNRPKDSKATIRWIFVTYFQFRNSQSSTEKNNGERLFIFGTIFIDPEFVNQTEQNINT